MRVGLNRLPIGKVNDQQQDDNQAADGLDKAQACCSQRDQQGKRCFRPIGGRGQGIEPEHGNAGEHANALLALFIRRQVPAEEQIADGHAVSTKRKDVFLIHRAFRGKEPALVKGPMVIPWTKMEKTTTT